VQGKKGREKKRRGTLKGQESGEKGRKAKRFSRLVRLKGDGGENNWGGRWLVAKQRGKGGGILRFKVGGSRKKGV